MISAHTTSIYLIEPTGYGLQDIFGEECTSKLFNLKLRSLLFMESQKWVWSMKTPIICGINEQSFAVGADDDEGCC